MCVIDTEAKEAAIAAFLREHPLSPADPAVPDHPALAGCADVAWSRFHRCPAGIPLLLRALLDRGSAPRAVDVLTTVLMDDIFTLNAAMPAALPFLIRLAAGSDTTVRLDLVRLLTITAELSEPVPADNATALLVFGAERDHPERARCRAVFAEHGPTVRVLLDADPEIGTDDRERLLRVLERPSPTAPAPGKEHARRP